MVAASRPFFSMFSAEKKIGILEAALADSEATIERLSAALTDALEQQSSLLDAARADAFREVQTELARHTGVAYAQAVVELQFGVRAVVPLTTEEKK